MRKSDFLYSKCHLRKTAEMRYIHTGMNLPFPYYTGEGQLTVRE